MTLLSPHLESIATTDDLAAFRAGLTGPAAMQLLEQANGRLLVQLPVGVGKTEWMTRIIDEAVADDAIDLVLVLVPLWSVLNELLNRLPPRLEPVLLKPRPQEQCGNLDEPWKKMEERGCGLLGRQRLCGQCPRRRGCHWPRQHESLQGARLVLTTQHRLVINPGLVDQIRQHAGARNVLVLLDESNILLRPEARLIATSTLSQFIQAQEDAYVAGGDDDRLAEEWLHFSKVLRDTTTADFREGNWTSPWIAPPWAIAVQEAGYQRYGSAFTFPGHELGQLGRSDPMSREITPDGVRFALPPDLGQRFIIFSGSMVPALARYRLDPSHRYPAIASPFKGRHFEHPDTRWFNIASIEGSNRYFPGNAKRILDFFATKVAANIRAGKRTLLVARKQQAAQCATYIQQRLLARNVAGARVVTEDWQKHELENPAIVPLITYGICGINLFEHYDAAYCLASYYVNAGAVTEVVQEIEASDVRLPVEVRLVGEPKRRVAQIELPDDRETILPELAQMALDQLEGDVVVQAVGRVRPFTRPREIITFQAGDLPGVSVNREFRSLREARASFQVPTRRTADAAARRERIQQMRAEGYTTGQIAKIEEVNTSTVRRQLKQLRRRA